MTDVDSSAAIAFVTLLLEPLPHTPAQNRVRDSLLSGDLEPLVWGMGGLLVGCLEALGSRLGMTPQELLQAHAPTIAGNEQEE